MSEERKEFIFKFNFITPNDIKGKTLFWDIDGTLTAYRFNGHVQFPSMRGEEGIMDISNGMYKARQPSKLMQRVVDTCEAKEQYILGRYYNTKEVSDKTQWLSVYFPKIKDVIWAKEGKSKIERLFEWIDEMGLKRKNLLKDAVIIDDSHEVLWEAEQYGIEAWHISSFLDWNEL